MARVKLKFPDKVLFKTLITISIEHINYGNHVGNDKFLSFCHEARLRFLKSLDQDELKFYDCSLIMADAELSYKGQVFHGDKLAIEIGAVESGPKSFEFYYRMINQNEEIVCIAKTGMVYFDYETNKVSSAPEKWLTELI